MAHKDDNIGVLVTTMEDLVTRRNTRTHRRRLPRGTTLERVVSEGNLVRPVVLLNGCPAAEPFGHVELREHDHVVMAEAPGTGAEIAGIVISIAAAAASALLAPRPHIGNVDTGTTPREERSSFGKLSQPALLGEPICCVLGTIRYGGKVVSVAGGEGVNGDGSNRLKMLIDFGSAGGTRYEAIGSLTDAATHTPVSDVAGIELNDQEIAGFTGCFVGCRMGTNDQSAISGFEDTFITIDVGLGSGSVLRNTSGSERTDPSPSGEAVSITTTGNVDAVVLRVALPQGLYTLSASGQTEPRKVKYRARDREVGGTWSAWVVYTVERLEQARFVSAPRHTVTTPGVPHEVQVERVSVEPADGTSIDQLIFEQLSEVTNSANTYANRATLGLDLVSGSQLTGRPDVSAIIKGGRVRVWDGVSGPDSPTFAVEFSDNPAALALHVLTDPIQFGGEPDSKVDFASLFECWLRSDELVPIPAEAGGGTRKRHRCGLIIDERKSLEEWLRVIGEAGDFRVVRVGHLWRFVAEMPRDTPSEVFTDGSVAVENSGTFGEASGFAGIEYVREDALGNRPNQVSVQFLDEDLNYTENVATWPPHGTLWLGGEDAELPRTKTMRLDGVHNFWQALTRAKKECKVERFLERSVSFPTTRPFVACLPGERFDVATSLMGWGLASGTLLPGSTASTLYLDRSISVDGSASIRVVHADGTIEVSPIAMGAGEYETGFPIALGTELSQTPSTDPRMGVAEYSVGALGLEVKPFITTEVRPAEDGPWAVAGYEYDADIYDDTLDAVDIPPYSTLDRLLRPPGPVSNLTARTVRATIADGVTTYRAQLAWTQTPEDAVSTSFFYVYRRRVGTTAWVRAPQPSIVNRTAEVDVVGTDLAYEFAVVAVSLGGSSLSPDYPGVPRVSLVFGLSQEPPAAPTGITVTRLANGSYRIDWDAMDGASEYQWLLGGDTTTASNVGAEECLVGGRVEDPFVILWLAPGIDVTVFVRSAGANGRLSWTAASIEISSPIVPDGFTVKETEAVSLDSSGTLTNLAWNSGASRLELTDPDAAGEFLSDEYDSLSETEGTFTFRPATSNDADDVPVDGLDLIDPSIEADQWGLVHGDREVGMLMPPWPDSIQAWTFEVRTRSAVGLYSAWTAILPGESLTRSFRYWQVRVTMARSKSPYRPALRGLTVVIHH